MTRSWWHSAGKAQGCWHAEIARSICGPDTECCPRRSYPPRMGRPPGGPPGRRVHSAHILLGRKANRGRDRNYTIPHHVIHGIKKTRSLQIYQPRKAQMRYNGSGERRFSKHTDYKQLPDGRWFVSYQDDASRLIVAFGVFKEATAEHAIDEQAIRKYRLPRYSRIRSSTDEKKTGPAGHQAGDVRHPQTNGKLERFQSEIKQSKVL